MQVCSRPEPRRDPNVSHPLRILIDSSPKNGILHHVTVLTMPSRQVVMICPTIRKVSCGLGTSFCQKSHSVVRLCPRRQSTSRTSRAGSSRTTKFSNCIFWYGIVSYSLESCLVDSDATDVVEYIQGIISAKCRAGLALCTYIGCKETLCVWTTSASTGPSRVDIHFQTNRLGFLSFTFSGRLMLTRPIPD